MTCLVGPQSSESVDWGPSTLNRLQRVLGVRFVHRRYVGVPKCWVGEHFSIAGGPLRKKGVPGEATTSKLCRVLDAANTGTEHKGKFNSKYLCCEKSKTRSPSHISTGKDYQRQ